jgi:hypothetical protein
VGRTTTLVLWEAGGASQLRFEFKGLPPGCSNTGAGMLNCTPTAPGAFNLTGTVVDSNGNYARAYIELVVTGIPATSGTSSASIPYPIIAGTGAVIIGAAAVVFFRRRWPRP